MTLVVKALVGPRPEPSVETAIGGVHPCQGWNVTAYSYGLSVIVEHLVVTRAEARRALALTRHLPGITSVSLAGPNAYAEVPPPASRGFTVAGPFPCTPA